jgi:hypothetical protein
MKLFFLGVAIIFVMIKLTYILATIQDVLPNLTILLHDINYLEGYIVNNEIYDNSIIHAMNSNEGNSNE